MSRNKSRQKRAFMSAIKDKLVALMVIFVLIFYPLLLPIQKIYAEDQISTQTETSSSEKESPAISEEKEVETKPETPTEQTKEEAPENVEAEKEVSSEQEFQSETIENETSNQPVADADNSTENQNLPTQTTTEISPVSNEDAQSGSPEETTSQNTLQPVVCCENEAECCEGECCPQATIENDNDAQIANATETTSDTGNNAIGESTVEPVATDEVIGQENSNQDSSQNNESQQNQESISPDDQIAKENAQPLVEGEIATGEALADNIIVNEVNTNIVSDNYIDSIINIIGDENGDINLLEQFQGLLASAQELNAANIEALTINNNNNANIENTISSDANSGINTIASQNTLGDSPTESAQIETGQATALADVVNIVNRNLIGNTWIFSVINVFGNWIGDLILPGEGLLQTPNTQLANNLEVVNENDASIVNNVDANANTGTNSIENAQNSLVATGDALSSANATNIANTNIIQNNWFVLLINNLGSWSGKILGGNDENNNSYQYNFETDNETDLLTSIYSFLSIHNKNSATVTNNVSANANTGNNAISGQVENAAIITGDAQASANVVNIVNTNITGNNWIFTIVNILGSWTGDAVMAYPDLAISINNGVEQIESGSIMTYTVTYENVGQANSDDAKVDIVLPDQLAYQNESQKNSTGIPLGKIKAGEKNSFTFTVVASNDGDPVDSQVNANISTTTKEVELSNNSSSSNTTIIAKQTVIPVESGQENLIDDELVEYHDPDSNLKISRVAMENPSMSVGSIVEQSIYVENKGDDPLIDIIVTEAIKDPNDKIVSKYSWLVPELDTHEKVLITYQLMINPNAETGTYSYRARGVATNSIGKTVNSNKASNNLVVFAIYFNNTQDDVDTVPAVINNGDIEIPYNEQVLGISNEKYQFPLWLILLIIIAVLVTVGAVWRILEKHRLKTSALKVEAVRRIKVEYQE